MTAPNMETITASLERSLQNFSLNSHTHHSSEGEGGDVVDDGIAIGSSSSSSSHNHLSNSNSDATLDLNSHISLPYHWEQCLDLKTGEIYYINWRNGMKAKEDPRSRIVGEQSGEYYYSEEEESWYDSEESSSESWPSSSKEHTNYHNNNNQNHHHQAEKQNNVLVVAGCKSCLMYFMVPKQVQHCPKCAGQLLHFDRSDNASSSP